MAEGTPNPVLLYFSPICFNCAGDVIPTCVLREADGQGRFLDLLSKQVLLVEEENDGSVNEEFVVTDGIEEHERLVHAVLQREVEERERGREKGRGETEKGQVSFEKQDCYFKVMR